MSELNRTKIAEDLRVCKGDVITAEGVALKEYLGDREYLDVLLPMVRNAHHRLIEVFKEIADGYAKLRDAGGAQHFAPSEEKLALMLGEDAAPK